MQKTNSTPQTIVTLDPPETHGLIRSRDLLSLGLSSHRIHQYIVQGELTRVRQGVLIAGHRWRGMSPIERYIAGMRAATLTISRPLTFSHESAAALWGLPVPASALTRIHALDPRASGGGGYRGVVIHRSDQTTHPVAINGLSATPVIRTLVDLARSRPLAESVPAIDDVLYRQVAGITQARVFELAATLETGQRGTRRAQRALLLARDGVESVGESISRVRIHELGFEEPELQKSFDGLPFRVDFWWPEAQVIGEFDGRVKYREHPLSEQTPEDVVWNEKRREDALRSRCRRFIRWDWAVAHSPRRLSALLESVGIPQIRGAALRRRTTQLTTPFG